MTLPPSPSSPYDAPVRAFVSRTVHQLGVVLEMIKFEHTLFALPFAFFGMILAAEGWPRWSTVGWIVAAMVGARSAAMGFNRLADRRLDAANPRTAGRALPAGQVSAGAAAVFVAASAALLVVAAWRLNPLAFALSPVALLVLLGYSYTKRFTWASHLVLGLSLGGAPLGAWIAVRGDVAAAPFCLAGAVLLWVAGFDVLYALQDLDFDRADRPLLAAGALRGAGGAGGLGALPRRHPGAARPPSPPLPSRPPAPPSASPTASAGWAA